MTPSRRLPAEWEPQSAVMLTWPHPATDWADQLSPLDQLYTRLSQIIVRYQQLIIVCHDDQQRAHVLQLLDNANCARNRVHLVTAACNDTWARDHGPLTCDEGGQLIMLDFQFNGWGGKYPAELDNQITSQLVEQLALDTLPLERIPFVLEGGAVESDGHGTLLATRSSVITETRNPGMAQSAVEQLLAGRLGISHFLWLDSGQLQGDDTDGHIDTLARFTDQQTIVYATARPGDPDHAELQAMAQQLGAFRTPQGAPYRLIPLPPVTPIRDAEGEILPAGYANFLIINGAVLLPVYGDDNDQAAVDCLQGCFPDREIIAIDCRPLIRQNGSLHCITMQFPAGLPLNG